ncbi:MAG: hypothetical protein AAGG75_02815 [Bacteroidota bacterium]
MTPTSLGNSTVELPHAATTLHPSHSLPAVIYAIIGLPSIDGIIHQLCPDIYNKLTSFKNFSLITQAYIFGEEHQIDFRAIKDMTNNVAADFIEGVRTLVKEQGIINVNGLQDYFDDYTDDFADIDIMNQESS